MTSDPESGPIRSPESESEQHRRDSAPLLETDSDADFPNCSYIVSYAFRAMTSSYVDVMAWTNHEKSLVS